MNPTSTLLPLLLLASSLPPTAAAPTVTHRPGRLPRLLLYHQTTHDPETGRPVSLLPLLRTRRIALTHLVLAAWHVRAADNNQTAPHSSASRAATLRLNDHPPGHPRFRALWAEVAVLQAAGVKVLAMVGGAARGSFARDALGAAVAPPPGGGGDGDGDGNGDGDGDGGGDGAFEAAYGVLRDEIRLRRLDGVDLDVEEPMARGAMVRLVRRLRGDFGRGFVITLAPVASALLGGGEGGGGNLSGFDYVRLEREVGREISFYNAQFYNGFGTAATTELFDTLVARGGWDPRRIVVGQLTSPANGGSGFVRHDVLARTVAELRRRYGEIGGVAGWEYFNGVPGGTGKPWKWAETMTAMLRPGRAPVLSITRVMAERLREAWAVSAAAARSGLGFRGRRTELVPNIDYLGMADEE